MVVTSPSVPKVVGWNPITHGFSYSKHLCVLQYSYLLSNGEVKHREEAGMSKSLKRSKAYQVFRALSSALLGT